MFLPDLTLPPRFLVLDDNPEDRRLVIRLLQRTWPQAVIHEAFDEAGFRQHLEQGDFDIVLTDYRLRWSDGLRVLREVRRRYPDKPVVFVTLSGSEAVAAQALREGVSAYVLKTPEDLQRLPEAIQQTLQRSRLAALQRYLQTLYDHLPIGVFQASETGQIVWCNPAAARLLSAEESLLDWVADEHREALQRLLIEVDEAPRMLTCRGKAPSQTAEYWVRFTLWRAGTDTPGRLYGLIEDITTERAQERLRERLLHTFQKALSEPAPERALRRLLEHLTTWLQADLGVLYWYLPEREVLQMGLRVGPSPRVLDSAPRTLQLGQGHLGWVAAHGEPLLLAHAEQDERAFYRTAPPVCEHLMAFPLHQSGELVGVLGFLREQDPPFSEVEFTQTLSFIGLLAALVSEIHAREAQEAARQHLERWATRLHSLYEASTQLAAATNTESVWEALHATAQRLGWLAAVFEAEADALRLLAISLPQPVEQALEAALHRPLVGLRIPLAQWPQMQHLLESATPHLGRVHQQDIDRIFHALGLPPEAANTWLNMVPEHTPLLGLPLHLGPTREGVLALWGEGLDEEAVPVLATLARQIEISLEKARLMAQAERRAQRTMTLVRLSAQLVEARSEEEIYHLVVNSLHQDLGYRYVRIYRLDAAGDRVLVGQRVEPALRATVPVRLKPGLGLSERAILEKRQIYAPRVQEHPEYIPGLGRGSEVETPILVGERVHGVLIVAHPEENAFTQEDLDLLQAVAHQTAVTLEKITLLENERRRANAQESLRAVLLDLASELNPEQLYQAMVERALALTEAQGVALWLPVRGRWQRAAARGTLPDTPHMPTLPRNDANTIALWGDPLGVPLRLRPDYWWVPLSLRGRILGWLECNLGQPPGSLDGGLATLGRALMLFGTQAAVALENARLFQETQQAAQRSAALYQAARRIAQSTLNAEEVYKAIHRAVMDTMGGDAFVLARYYPETRDLVAVYVVDGQHLLPRQRLPLNASLSGYVVQTGKSLLIHNLEEALESLPFQVQRLGRMMASILAVPLPGPQGPLGAISVQALRPNAFTEDDLRLLETLASHAAVALENALLFERTHQLAITDELTGIYNRRQLFNLGAREVQRARRFQRPLAAMLIDLDDFKQVNDTYGHSVGDEVLRLWARRVAGNIRDIDILGRYGGEEFGLVLPETELEAAIRLAERLRNLIAGQPFLTSAGPLHLSVSIGVTVWQPSIQTMAELFREADHALYLAKRHGKNCTAWKRPNEPEPRLVTEGVP